MLFKETINPLIKPEFMKQISILIISILISILPAWSQTPGNPDATAPITVGNAITSLQRPSPYNQNGNTAPTLFNFTREYMLLQPRKDATQINMTTPSSVCSKSTTYTDGWGRPMQTISHDVSFFNSLVTGNDYRPASTTYSFPAYAVNHGTGYAKFQMSPFTAQEAYYNSLYPNEQGAAASMAVYASDNNKRISTAYAPGRSNIGNGKGTTEATFLNLANEVIQFNEPAKGMLPVKQGYYPAGTLMKKVATNADGAWIAEFHDKTGKLICQKQLVGTTKIDLMEQDGSQNPINHYSDRYAWTYYIYDEFGRSRYTISPKGVEAFIANGNVFSQQILDELSDYLEYDSYGRTELQHRAGETGNNYFVYDKKDRVVMSQSPQLEDEGKWTFTCYDELDRVIMTGIVNNAYNDRTYWQNAVNAAAPVANPQTFLDYIATEGVFFQGLNSTSSMLGNAEFLAYYNYDRYRAITISAINQDNANGIVAVGFGFEPGEFANDTVHTVSSVTPALSVRTKGLLIASKVKVLNPTNIPDVNTWITAFNYYDEFGRNIQTRSRNHCFGDDIVSTQYNFNGSPLRQITDHENPKSTKPVNPKVTRIVKDYTYDPTFPDKIKTIKEQIDGSTFRVVASYTYDDLGRIKSKDIGDLELQEYEYNLRGQLTAINRDHVTNPGSTKNFGEIISYDREFADIYYNGKVAGTIWREEGASIPKSYAYSYDLAGQLLNGEYLENPTGQPFAWSNTSANYTEGNIVYDANGNLKFLKRYGNQNGQPGLIDDLEYIYRNSGNSNVLQIIDDHESHPNPATYEFTHLPLSSHSHAYDHNGNLLADDNKGLTLENNAYLNKPIRMNQNGNDIHYVYDALGNKLVEQHTGTSDRFDFIGSVMYRNFDLAQVNCEEGYTTYDSTQFHEELYFVRDHIGNVRQVLKKVASGYTAPPNDGNWRAEISFELPAAPAEELVAVLLGAVRDGKPLSVDPNDQYAALLDAGDPARQIGAVQIFNLMAGDRIKLGADCYYETITGEAISVSPEDMMNNIVGSLTGEGGITGGEAGAAQIVETMFSSDNYLNVFQSIKSAQTDFSKPLSYLNYIFFDENLNIVPEQSGAIQIATTDGGWTTVALGGNFDEGMTVQAGGTLITYISHEGGGGGLVKAHWDNITSEVYYGDLKEKFHYYPFGNVVTLTSNYQQLKRHLYQTKEYNNDLQLYDFHARQYDPLLGRFTGLDPVINGPSGFVGMANDPVSTIDPDGRNPLVIAAVVGGVVGGAVNTAVHWKHITAGGSVNWERFGTAFGIGAAAGAVAGLTGGASLAGSGATTVLGVAGQGALSGGIAYTASSPILQIGNNVAFGDPIMGAKEYFTGLGLSMLTGAVFNTIFKGTPKPTPTSDASTASASQRYGYWSSIEDDWVSAAQHFESTKMALDDVVITAKQAVTPPYPHISSIPGTVERVFLRQGQRVDRYGSRFGNWLAPEGTPYSARSIPAGKGPYMQFEVMKPFEVTKSIATPGFQYGQNGFGTQYQTPVSIDVLIKRGFLRVK